MLPTSPSSEGDVKFLQLGHLFSVSVPLLKWQKHLETWSRWREGRSPCTEPTGWVSHSLPVWAASLWEDGREGGRETKQYKKHWRIHQETDEGVPPASYNLPKSHTTRTKGGHAPAALSVISGRWKVNWSLKSSPAQWCNIMSFPLWCVWLHIVPTEGKRCAAVWIICLSGLFIKAKHTPTRPNGTGEICPV